MKVQCKAGKDPLKAMRNAMIQLQGMIYKLKKTFTDELEDFKEKQEQEDSDFDV